MSKHVLILGGYGGVGKVLSLQLLKLTDVSITIAGRNAKKAEEYALLLQRSFPKRKILFSYADAGNKKSIVDACKNADVMIVTTTTPDNISTIADAAIDSNTDMIDVLVRGDVVDKLEQLRSEIVSHNRIFITQAGFHPGLPAPFIKYSASKFDALKTANVVMVMNSLFEKPESTHEIIHEIGEANAKILKKGEWHKATYKDALTIQFSAKFGTRVCYPLQMREIYPLASDFGIDQMGVYSAGFNPFVDNVVFPLTMFLQTIRKGLGTNICGKLMHWGVNKYFKGEPGVEFKLIAHGIKDGLLRQYSMQALSTDAFEFTAMAVIACLKQYFGNRISAPGLYLMGNVVDKIEVIDDLKAMGIQIVEEFN